MMGSRLLGLLVFVQLRWVLVAGAVVTLSEDCGAGRVGYLKTSDGYEFFIDQRKAQDVELICSVLEFYFTNGCLDFGSHKQAIGDFGKKYCGQNFRFSISAGGHGNTVKLLRRAGRKLLLKLSTNDSIHKEMSQKTQRQEAKQFHFIGSTSDHIMIAVPGMFLLCCSLLCPCFRAKRKDLSEHPVLDRDLNSMDSASPFELSSTPRRIPGSPLQVPSSPSRFSLSAHSSTIGPLHLSINQIIRITNNFSPSLKVGEGGFGTVYKAELPDGQVVAIKRAKKEHFGALKAEFVNEVALLTTIEHRNLVRLLGYADKGDEQIIITEYVPNGTLREHLDGLHGRILDFSERLEIAIDVAHGLTYLHLYAEKPIIHRDVKSSNILLTESLRGKVGDFGFARTGPTGTDETHIETIVRGTAGYVDPEYLRTNRLTAKSDVYSFGILFLEILSARRPVEMKRNSNERISVRWAFNKFIEGNVRDILDPLLKEVVDEEVLKKSFGLAFECAAPTRDDRPVMKEVVEQLWEIRKEYSRTRRNV